MIALALILANIDIQHAKYLFSSNSMLAFLNGNSVLYIIVIATLTSIGLYVNALFSFMIADTLNNFIRSGLVYLGFIWLFSIFAYRTFPFYFSPMTSIMYDAYLDYTLFQLMAPYTFFVIGYVLLKRRTYEV